MAKIVVPFSQLPDPNITGDQVIRFRIISEDRNSFSQWSKLFTLDSQAQRNPQEVEVNMVALTEGGPYELSWDSSIYISSLSANFTKGELQPYDIFVQFGASASLNYYTRVTGNRVTIYSSTSLDAIRVVGQLPTHPSPPAISNDFKIFDTGVVSL